LLFAPVPNGTQSLVSVKTCATRHYAAGGSESIDVTERETQQKTRSQKKSKTSTELLGAKLAGKKGGEEKTRRSEAFDGPSSTQRQSEANRVPT